jgi:hypothetical protein
LPSGGAEAAALHRQFIAAEISKLRDRAARLRCEREARAERAAAAAPLSGTVESGRRERHLAMNYRRAEVGAELARKLRNARLADEDLDGKASGSGRPAARCASEEKGELGQEINPAPLNSPPSPHSAQPPVSGTRSPGPGGGVFPLLLLLLVLLRLGIAIRDTGPAPHSDRGALVDVTPHALGAWGRSPQGKTPDAAPPVPGGASPAAGRLNPSHPGRRASLLHHHGRFVRRASLAAWGRRPHGKTRVTQPPAPAAAGASPAPGRVEAHRHRPGLRWASRRIAAFDPPCVCRNEPELGASRAACAESSSATVKASRIGLRPRDSPGLHGPPWGRD